MEEHDFEWEGSFTTHWRGKPIMVDDTYRCVGCGYGIVVPRSENRPSVIGCMDD